jgi:AcrR family transcriptional regulator
VLEAAEATFGEHGVDRSKMEQIAEAAGLSLGTVYAVFCGKASIVDALHERRLREVLERAGVAVRDLSDPLETLIAEMELQLRRAFCRRADDRTD